MNARVDELLTLALRLPTDERSALVVVLLDSIADTANPSIAEAWREEIALRRQALRSGAAASVPWAAARARIDLL